jgi:pimeloyl-ACP methyl ester carboxylesterase
MVGDFRDVKASGIRLRVTDRGQGPSILLLHTLFVDRTCWQPLVERLAQSFRVIAPDLPGCGESEKPAKGRFPYSISSITDVITALYAGLGLGQAYVVGHGLGGAVAVELASRYPELVSRQLLLDAWCYPTRPDPTLRLANVPIVGGIVFKQLLGKAALRSHFRDRLSSPAAPLSTQRFDYYYSLFNSPSARSSALTILRNTRDTRHTRAALSRISVPSLVVWGRDDALCSPSEGREMARQIRGCGFELLDAGHLVPEQRPAELTETILRFGLAQRAQ